MRMHHSIGILTAAALGMSGLAAASTTAELISAPRHGSGKRRNRYGTSKYTPHQGKREIARRLRQAERLASKASA